MKTDPWEKSAVPPLQCIYFYLTEGCNLKCRHCWIRPPWERDCNMLSRPYINFELFRKIVEQALPLGLNSVKLTGGEPLLNPEIRDILGYIAERKLKLILETNATLCTSEIATLIAACPTPFVSVSLDGATARQHEWVRQVPGCFEQALAGIGQLVKVGIRPQFIMSVMRRNYTEIAALIQLAANCSACSVKLNLVTSTARATPQLPSAELLSVAELIALGREVIDKLAPAATIPVIYSQPPAFSPLSTFCCGSQGGCCGIYSMIGVLGNGHYALCGIGETISELVFADAQNTPLTQVWHRNPTLQAIRSDLPGRLEGVCRKCLLRNRCLGYCIANNYKASGSLYAANDFCQQAFDAGLFPATRLRPAAE